MNHYVFMGLPLLEKTSYLGKFYNPEKIAVCINLLCSNMRFSVLDVKSNTRLSELVNARFVIWNYLRSTYNMPLQSIGDIFGRNHATVLYGLRKYKDLMKTDKDFQKLNDSAINGTEPPYRPVKVRYSYDKQTNYQKSKKETVKIYPPSKIKSSYIDRPTHKL